MKKKGYIGIAKLRSVPIDEHGYKMSVAEGYYGIGKESFPQRIKSWYWIKHFIEKLEIMELTYI